MSQNTRFGCKLAAFVNLPDNDEVVESKLLRMRRVFPAKRDLIRQGETGQTAFILNAGWTCSYKILLNGARQILDFQVPGDFLGLRLALFQTADHNVETITEVEVSEVSSQLLTAACARAPFLVRGLLWAAARDEAILEERLVGMGRRSAGERLAHFLLELSARLNLVGLSDATGYDCPLTQYLLADALGLTAVHINRVMRELREYGLVSFQNGRVSFLDFDGLVTFADFDRSYLDQDLPVKRLRASSLAHKAA